MSEIVEEIVGALNSIITDILDKKGILKAEDFTINNNVGILNKEVARTDQHTVHVDAVTVNKTQVVTDAIPVDTIIDVAPNEIIETQETYTIGEDGKIENQGEPSNNKKYSL